MKLLKHAMVTAAATGLMLGMVHPPSSAANIGQEGCTPGYWKNHTSNWEEYAPTTTLAVALQGYSGSYSGSTLLQALRFQGGSSIDGAKQILLRATAAALLNAAHEGVGYPYRRFEDPLSIIARVKAALASGDRATILRLATTLDTANNLGCPLD